MHLFSERADWAAVNGDNAPLRSLFCWATRSRAPNHFPSLCRAPVHLSPQLGCAVLIANDTSSKTELRPRTIPSVPQLLRPVSELRPNALSEESQITSLNVVGATSHHLHHPLMCRKMVRTQPFSKLWMRLRGCGT